MTFYLGVVDPAADGSWGAVFPDLPGCNSAGGTMDELYENAIEALRLWAEDALADEGHVPPPRAHAALTADPKVLAMLEAAGPRGCIIQVPLLLDAGRTVRATISLDAGKLEAIDVAARRRGETRSAFLVRAAEERIARSERIARGG